MKALATILLMLLIPISAQAVQDNLEWSPDMVIRGQDAAGGYLACGCGCCPGGEPLVKCVSGIDELEEAKQKDREQAYSKQCPMMGCSLGVIYRICD